MKYEGLLTNEQKRVGYFVTQDEDFVFLWHGRDGNPDIIAVFLYDDVRIKQVREAADEDNNLCRTGGQGQAQNDRQ